MAKSAGGVRVSDVVSAAGVEGALRGTGAVCMRANCVAGSTPARLMSKSSCCASTADRRTASVQGTKCSGAEG